MRTLCASAAPCPCEFPMLGLGICFFASDTNTKNSTAGKQYIYVIQCPGQMLSGTTRIYLLRRRQRRVGSDRPRMVCRGKHWSYYNSGGAAARCTLAFFRRVPTRVHCRSSTSYLRLRRYAGEGARDGGEGAEAEQRARDAGRGARRLADGRPRHPRPHPLRHPRRLPPLRLRRYAYALPLSPLHPLHVSLHPPGSNDIALNLHEPSCTVESCSSRLHVYVAVDFQGVNANGGFVTSIVYAVSCSRFASIKEFMYTFYYFYSGVLALD